MGNIITTDAPSRHHVIIYFEKGNEYVKDFAARMRNADPVDVTLCWSRQFTVDDITAADAIVIEVDCERAENIERAYRRVYGDKVEVHYMTREGAWHLADEVESVPDKPLLSEAPETVTDIASDTVADDTVEPDVASVDDGSDDADIEPVSDDVRSDDTEEDTESDDSTFA